MRFFAISWSLGMRVELDPDGLIEDYGLLFLELMQNLNFPSSDEEIDESYLLKLVSHLVAE